MPTKVVHKTGGTELEYYNTVEIMCLTWESYFRKLTKTALTDHFTVRGNEIQYVHFTFQFGDECAVIEYVGGFYKKISKGKITTVTKKTISLIGDEGNTINIPVGGVILPLEFFYQEVEQKLNRNCWHELPDWMWERLGVKTESQLTSTDKIERALWLALIPDNWTLVLLQLIGILLVWNEAYEFMGVAIFELILFEGAYVGANLFIKKCRGYW